jgi:chromosome segregation ATPase
MVMQSNFNADTIVMQSDFNADITEISKEISETEKKIQEITKQIEALTQETKNSGDFHNKLMEFQRLIYTKQQEILDKLKKLKEISPKEDDQPQSQEIINLKASISSLEAEYTKMLNTDLSEWFTTSEAKPKENPVNIGKQILELNKQLFDLKKILLSFNVKKNIYETILKSERNILKDILEALTNLGTKNQHLISEENKITEEISALEKTVNDDKSNLNTFREKACLAKQSITEQTNSLRSQGVAMLAKRFGHPDPETNSHYATV